MNQDIETGKILGSNSWWWKCSNPGREALRKTLILIIPKGKISRRMWKMKIIFFLSELEHQRWYCHSSAVLKYTYVVQLLSYVWLFCNPHGLQHARLYCPSLSPGVCSNSCPLSRLYNPTISSFVAPFSSCLNLSQYQRLLQWVGSSHQVAQVLKFLLQHQSFQWIFRVDFMIWSFCSQRDFKHLL